MNLLITLLGWAVGLLLVVGIASWLRLVELLWYGLGSIAAGVFTVLVLRDLLTEGSLTAVLQRMAAVLFIFTAGWVIYGRYGHCDQGDYSSAYCGDTVKSWATVILLPVLVVLGASITHHIGSWVERWKGSRADDFP